MAELSTASSMQGSVNNLEMATKLTQKGRSQVTGTPTPQPQVAADSFKPAKQAKTASNPALNPSQPARSTASPMLNVLKFGQQIQTAVNNVQVGTLRQIDEFMSRYVNIMDKISAVFGEKEKDLRDKLSDTFKQQREKVYTPLGEIDASMEQNDHHKEKKIKESDPELQEDDGSVDKIN